MTELYVGWAVSWFFLEDDIAFFIARRSRLRYLMLHGPAGSLIGTRAGWDRLPNMIKLVKLVVICVNTQQANVFKYSITGMEFELRKRSA